MNPLVGVSPYLPPDTSNQKTPCVGVSLGVERLFSIMETRAAEGQISVRPTHTQVLVASGQGMIEERLQLCTSLWAAGIPAEVCKEIKTTAWSCWF